MKSSTTPQLILAPVTANQDWLHRFTTNNAEELRKAIAEAHTKGPFTVQYLMSNPTHYARIYSREPDKQFEVLETNFISKAYSEVLWRRVKCLEHVNMQRTKEL